MNNLSKKGIIMADQNFTFNRHTKPFGLNVKVPERTLHQAGETLEGISQLLRRTLFSF